MNRMSAVFLIIFGLSSIAACGQKGPLYMPPDDEADTSTAEGAPPASEEPTGIQEEE